MFHSRRDSLQSRPEVSLRYVIVTTSVLLFVVVPLGILLGLWLEPWLFKLCAAIAQWLFY